MSQSEKFDRKVDLADLGKRDMRAQFAALPWRRVDGRIEVCLITSRDTGRWIVPKGWPMPGKTPSEAAATETFEEAGLRGVVSTRCAGIYTYLKDLDDGIELPVMVAVFPLEVTKSHADWPEAKVRTRKWFSLKKAARNVSDPELRDILRDPGLAKVLR